MELDGVLIQLSKKMAEVGYSDALFHVPHYVALNVMFPAQTQALLSFLMSNVNFLANTILTSESGVDLSDIYVWRMSKYDMLSIIGPTV